MFPFIIIGGVLYLVARATGNLPSSLDFPLPSLTDIENAANDPAAALQDVEGHLQTIAGQLPSAVTPYADFIQASAAKYGVEPLIIIGLGWQESRWGTTPQLDTSGPSGTGDFLARSNIAEWSSTPNTRIIQALTDGRVTNKWYSDVKWAPGPWVIPSDGRGWGRGLMQLDWQLAQTLQWDDTGTNIDAGANVFATDFKTAQSSFPQFSYETLVLIALAFYNGGPKNVTARVKAQIAAGTDEADINPDLKSDGTLMSGGYSAKVMGYIDSWGGLQGSGDSSPDANV